MALHDPSADQELRYQGALLLAGLILDLDRIKRGIFEEQHR